MVSIRKIYWLTVLVSLTFSGLIYAETPADIRYEIFRHDDGRYRFDRITGKLEKMMITAEGVVYSEMPVLVSSKAPSGQNGQNGQNGPQPVPPVRVAPKIEMGSQIETHPVVLDALKVDATANKRKGIQLQDADGNNLMEEISDDERKAALADIVRYEKELAIMQTLRSKDRITGAIVLGNKGDRAIQKLEVTLYVPIAGKEKPMEYRFVFNDSGAANSPLQPLGLGLESRSWLQTVDIACPPGNTKGNFEVKLTYIKFHEKPAVPTQK